MSRETPPDPRAGDNNPQALWSLLLGIVSLVLTGLCGYGLLIGFPAVYLGWKGKDQSPGRGLAIAGIVTGGLSIVFGLLWLMLVAFGAVPRPAEG